ncbi:MAG: CRISPR-associated DxTHG motif protein [Campylobacteraceae bacterium]|jgi:CRISPR-associated DxTHG motif protein|nr:CRISPR-associated DxTHG motif protein [Campylobacteraceae bacterium]
MKIVTIVGIIDKEKAKYWYDEQLSSKFKLKRENYTNMLPLLIDNFSDKDTIIPIFTDEAKNRQINVLKNEFNDDYSNIFKKEYLIEYDKNYYGILSLINQIITQEGDYIIDLSHGFRHIPILATISLIAHNINNPSNIKHILFAKEIVQYKEYEIIDLKEYLELANISYVLESFVDNYTIFLKSNFTNKLFQNLSNELKSLSNHILSNAIQNIFNSSILKNTLKNIDEILIDEKVSTFKHSLVIIKEHLKNIQEIGKLPKPKQLYEFSKLLSERGYLLNAITLLFEAIGCYCLESLKEIDATVKEYIEGRGSHYKQDKEARNIIANSDDYKNKKDKEMENKINIFFKSKNISSFKKFIEKAKELRNELAHGNNEEEIKDAKKKFLQLTKKYKEFCIDKDILGKNIK